MAESTHTIADMHDDVILQDEKRARILLTGTHVVCRCKKLLSKPATGLDNGWNTYTSITNPSG
jgi:hypothetical protein